MITAALLGIMMGCCMVGLCVVNHSFSDVDDHGIFLDLCTAMLAVLAMVGAALVTALVLEGLLHLPPAPLFPRLSLNLPDPPPKALALA